MTVKNICKDPKQGEFKRAEKQIHYSLVNRCSFWKKTFSSSHIGRNRNNPGHHGLHFWNMRDHPRGVQNGSSRISSRGTRALSMILGRNDMPEGAPIGEAGDCLLSGTPIPVPVMGVRVL